MHSQKFKINIENPCTVDKQNLTATETGFFCAQCQKCVVDYTQYSDRQLIHQFGTNGNTGCGIFTQQQLEKVYAMKAPTQKRHWPLWLFSGLFATRLVAQEQPAMDSIPTAQYPTSDTLLADSAIAEVLEVADPQPMDSGSLNKGLKELLLSHVSELEGCEPTIGIVSQTITFGDFITPKHKDLSPLHPINVIIKQSKDTVDKVIQAMNPFRQKPKPLESSPTKNLFATWLLAMAPQRFKNDEDEV